jgi:hypothetical protein
VSNLLKFPEEWKSKRQQFDRWDDFLDDQSDLFWIDTVTDTGTAAVGDLVDGIMVLTPSDGTVADNDEVYLATANEVFKFAADRPFVGGARIKFTETTATVYNCGVFFMNAIAANSIIDDGGGLKVSGSTAGIYKVDGGTNWLCVTANNSASTVSTSSTAAASASYQNLEIEVLPFTSTQVKVAFRVDGVPLKDSTTGLAIVHTVTVASATEMQFGMGAKLGAITNNDALNVDAAWFAGIRANL